MNSPRASAWIGYDSRMPVAFAVAKYSLRQWERYIPVNGLVLSDLQRRGLYRRPTQIQNQHQLWDVISNAPMSTEFSISRFLVPHLAGTGMALFCDSDVLFRESVSRLFEMAVDGKAVYCVKHEHDPKQVTKMDGQIQTRYSRKNWSSVMLFDCDHPSNQKLTVDMVNTLPGRDLHRFCWLEDDEIGELPPQWNYLVGQGKMLRAPASIVHFTEGLPDMDGYGEQEYADVWLEMRPRAVGAL